MALYIAKSKRDFLIKLTTALDEANDDVKIKRKEVAEFNDWLQKAKILECNFELS